MKHIDSRQEKYSYQWMNDIRNLRNSAKQKTISWDRAIILAEKIFSDYQKNGIEPTIDILNAHIQMCENVDQIRNTIKKYKKGKVIKLNTTSYNIIISKANNFEEGNQYFAEMIDSGIWPNTYTLNCLISFCDSVEESKQIMKGMKKYRVKPNTQTYNTILSKSKNANESKEVLMNMENKKIQRNLVTYNTLISQAINYTDAVNIYFEIKSRNISPSINTLVTLLKKVKTGTELEQVDKMLENENLIPNNSWIRNFKRIKNSL